MILPDLALRLRRFFCRHRRLKIVSFLVDGRFVNGLARPGPSCYVHMVLKCTDCGKCFDREDGHVP
jgi:hypothetical protein